MKPGLPGQGSTARGLQFVDIHYTPATCQSPQQVLRCGGEQDPERPSPRVANILVKRRDKEQVSKKIVRRL